MISRPANNSDIANIALLYVQNHTETYKGLLPDAYFEKCGAKHFSFFDDDFGGVVSHSEKLIWNL